MQEVLLEQLAQKLKDQTCEAITVVEKLRVVLSILHTDTQTDADKTKRLACTTVALEYVDKLHTLMKNKDTTTHG